MFGGEMNYKKVLGVCFVSAILGTSASANDNTAKVTSAFDFEHVSCKGLDNEIRIVIKDVKKSIGLITADLYPNNQETFLRGKGRVKKVKFAARAPMTQFCVTTPEEGDFAMAVYHDRNANGTFDKTGLGLPAEPWGISNNPKVNFGPPPVEKALFKVTKEGAQLEIELN